MSLRPRVSARFLSLALATSLVAGAGAVGLAVPAVAASSDATDGSLRWGVAADYRAVFTTRANTAPATFVDDLATFPLASGSYDDAAGTGQLAFGGAIRLGYVAGAPTQVGTAPGNYVWLESPMVSIAGGAATISGITAGSSHGLNPELPTAAKAQRTVATVDLSAVDPTVTDSTITWAGAPTSITDQGALVLAKLDGSDTEQTPQKRAAGSSLDPVTITVDRVKAAPEVPAEPEPTTPEPTTPEPEPTTPEPTTPDPGTPVPPDPGTPDPGTPTESVDTTTTVAVTTPSPVLLGQSTTVTATVTPARASGDVTFTGTRAGQIAATTLGTAPLVDGVATLTTTLPAGGHSLSASYAGATIGGATYSPSAGTLMGTGSSASTPANHAVVDVSQPAACSPTAGATTTEGVTARWGWSTYSDGWTKTATGDVTLDGETFVLSDGVATGTADCTVVDFTGVLRVAAYESFFPTAGQWIELVDPRLSIAADGTGTWSAGVRSGTATDDDSAAVRTVVATVTGASVPDLTTTGTLTAPLAYQGTTAQGTWSKDWSDAWSNAFVVQVPSAIRAFYFASGTTAANATKPPLPISLSWAGAPVTPEPGEPTVPTVPSDPTDPEVPTIPTPIDPTVGSGNLAWGVKESFRSYLAGMAKGTTTTSGGATIAGDGRFVFAQAADGSDFDPATGVGTIRYTGGVLFSSASHGFAIGFSDPWIVSDADGTSRLTALTSTSDTAGLDSTERITLVTLAQGTATGTAPSATGTSATGTSGTGTSGVSLLAALAAEPTTRWTDVAATFSDTLSPDGWAQYRGLPADAVSFGFDASVVEPGQPGTAPVVPPVPSPGTVPAGTDPVALANGTATEQDRCVARSVSGATLSWGFKESFRSYITGPIAKGAVSLSGVTTASDGSYVWSGGTGSVNTADTRGRVAFDGGVVFTGHGSALRTTIDDPRVQLTSAGTAVLVVDLTSKDLDTGATTSSPGLTIATLALGSGSRNATDSTLAYSGVPATLTAAAAEAFAGFYEGGAALDPVSFSLPLGATVACDPTTRSTGLAYTGGSGLDALLLGGLLVLVGGGLVVARRRGLLGSTHGTSGAISEAPRA